MTAPVTVRKLLLLRHGQTVYNAESRMQGQLDTALSPLGEDQAARAAVVLARCKPVAIVSSDLHRAYDTAVALGDEAGMGVVTDVRLRETHLGEWQGWTHSDVDAKHPGARAQWRLNATLSPPGGESRVDVAQRSVPVVEELLARYDNGDADLAAWNDRPVVLVAHGGLISALTAKLLDLPVSHWQILGGLGNASWVQLSHFSNTGLWRLDVWNSSAEVAPDVSL
ncbi:histidine phosphatase family protein [Hoyosella rhizosphaerae]|uniref:Phosphoglycerate mutase n=1 Tax=Hoyosella rhizosphaerae TaxID=1755582 RepID=A0A916XGP1_9ACTN|nr:histidine phosphatase family protein [Hoyosella rhizosphaerae]MBN4928073.1 histidine phosphatase family protein [Hoyosella rhizosphaerae]GGC72188.1 phosphoglycerate mutase [Hoyosella rhizosphaerae]